MDRENEKRVVEEICLMSETYDYSDTDDIEKVLSKVNNIDYFKESVFGKRYIQRLTMLSTGLEATDCVLCGKGAVNRVVCNTCMQKLGELQHKKRRVEKKETIVSNKPLDTTSDMSSDISIEELFRDMDDSLLQLASQGTAKTIKRLSWINIALSVVNFIMIFFLTLFLWKFITTT